MSVVGLMMRFFLDPDRRRIIVVPANSNQFTSFEFLDTLVVIGKIIIIKVNRSYRLKQRSLIVVHGGSHVIGNYSYRYETTNGDAESDSWS